MRLPPPILLYGMHGIGDNLHERAIAREFLKRGSVWFKTSWPQMYWDLPQMWLLPLQSPIPWMAKNEQRCARMYSRQPPPSYARTVRVAYPWRDAKRTSVLEAMARACGVDVGDFRLPIAPVWQRKADDLIDAWRPDAPICITRPLLDLVDVRNPGSALAKRARNPDQTAYRELFAAIRERYFIVSIADVMAGRERVLTRLDADVELHNGEVDFETIAALTARADLVYCSPCFLTVLAQAVSTPLICVFGGFEGANSFAAGARYSPWLPIEPEHACRCWTINCRHDKTIDVPAAKTQIERFLHANTAYTEHAQKPAATAAAHPAA